MLEITDCKDGHVHYRISGKLSVDDLSRYYRTIDEAYRRFGKLELTAWVTGFAGYRGFAAVRRFILHEPALLYKVRAYTIVTDQRWLRQVVNGLDALLPHISLRALRPLT